MNGRVDMKLKPCPFCGGKATLDEITDEDGVGIGDFVVSCSNCEAFLLPHNNKQELIDQWNTRYEKA